MNYPTQKSMASSLSLATICAEHTRRVQHLTMEFYSGKLSIQQYRKRSRELTQGLVDELEMLAQNGKS